MFFTYFYWLFCVLIHTIASPLLLLGATVNLMNERRAILARFFLYKNPPLSANKILVHCASLGELSCLMPIYKALSKHIADDIVITVSSSEAHYKACKTFSEVRFLPFETFIPFWLTSPRILIGIEAEYWYLLFLYAKKVGAETIMINARMSKRSLRRYYSHSYLYNRIFKEIDYIFCQNYVDKKRLSLFKKECSITVTGNIKTIVDITLTKQYDQLQGLNIIAASTHKGEEKLILSAFTKLNCTNKRLFIAPRLPYRFDEVANILKQFCNYNGSHYIDFVTFDTMMNEQLQDKLPSLVLVDKIGVLNNLYAITDIAIMGGSFLKIKLGGHNPLEPAHFGCKVISGNYITNQIEAFKAISHYEICNYQQHNNLYNVLMKVVNRDYAKPTIKHRANIEPIIKIING